MTGSAEGDGRVVPLGRQRVGEAAAALARAFVDDPTFVSLWPEEERRARALRRFLAVPIADGIAHGQAEGLELDGRLAGAAVWYAPGAYPMTTRRQVAVVPRMLTVAAVAPRAFGRLGRFGANIDAAFPDDRPWYLALIGLAPEAQGRGLGTRLLHAGLERCDAAGGDCYLETDTEGAARLYERLGFETVEAAAQLLPDGPTHRRMRRPARPARAG